MEIERRCDKCRCHFDGHWSNWPTGRPLCPQCGATETHVVKDLGDPPEGYVYPEDDEDIDKDN